MTTPDKARDTRVLLPWPGVLAGMLLWALDMVLSWLPSRSSQRAQWLIWGVGGSFYGPDARLGSFTPFLDKWTHGSLYWENFLATQGRTLAVLPSVLASLPCADLGEHPKPHHSLPSWAERNRYVLRYSTGTDLTLDHQADFLRSVDFETLHSAKNLVGVDTRVRDGGDPDGDLLPMVVSQPWPTLASLTKAASEHMPDIYDHVVLMDDHHRALGPDGILSPGQQEIDHGRRIGKSVWRGLEFSTSERAKPISHGHTTADARRALQLVKQALAQGPALRGIVIHHAGTYLRWLREHRAEHSPLVFQP